MPGAQYDATKHHITAAYAVVVDDGRVLLCRHAELRRSAWTAPGGFVLDGREPHETVRAVLHSEASVGVDLDEAPFLIWDGGMSALPQDEDPDALQRVRAAYRARVDGSLSPAGSTAYEWFSITELPEPRTRLVDVAMSALFAPRRSREHVARAVADVLRWVGRPDSARLSSRCDA